MPVKVEFSVHKTMVPINEKPWNEWIRIKITKEFYEHEMLSSVAL